MLARSSPITLATYISPDIYYTKERSSEGEPGAQQEVTSIIFQSRGECEIASRKYRRRARRFAVIAHFVRTVGEGSSVRGLRFCFITTFYPPYNFGGDGIAVQRLARALIRRGHCVTVIHDVDA